MSEEQVLSMSSNSAQRGYGKKGIYSKVLACNLIHRSSSAGSPLYHQTQVDPIAVSLFALTCADAVKALNDGYIGSKGLFR